VQWRYIDSITWAPTGMGKGGGHLPIPGNVKKCYRVKKPSPKSLWTTSTRSSRRQKCIKKSFFFRRGCAPNPAGRAYGARPDPLAGGYGLAAPPQEPHCTSGLRASARHLPSPEKHPPGTHVYSYLECDATYAGLWESWLCVRRLQCGRRITGMRATPLL